MSALSRTTPSAVPAALATAPAAAAPAHTHDLLRQTVLLRDALQSDRVGIGLFLGAGCPLGVYDEKGEKSLKLIPDVATLTDDLHAGLKSHDAGLANDKKAVPCWDALVQACKDGGDAKPTVEHILTELRAITGRKGKNAIDGIGKDRLKELDATLCDLVADAVGKNLPPHVCAYNRLATWIGGVQRTAPIDLFTPNYDLLVEEAFERQRIPHFDGFVGSREPFFDIASIEQDAIPRRWTRLWKLHGSINWQRREDGEVFRAQGRAAKGKAMIYPSHLKYDQSRRMPYLAMIDRLRAFFRSPAPGSPAGPPVLVVCGYSFSDDHLNEVLLDGLRGNQSAQCFVLEYKSLGEAMTVTKLAGGQPNMTVLAQDGAVVGTRTSPYSELRVSISASESWIHRPSAAAGPVQSRLGDFHYFALFLEQLYGGRTEIGHGISCR